MARVQRIAHLKQAHALRDLLTAAGAALALCYFGTSTHVHHSTH
ncbi:hypothetical protein [Paraburkholderia sp. C35]|nr:hypothetical protein [Paraburkholderia sp. C35]